jgi:CubicO group peptidase (beta-lactamase class C family)
VADGRIDGERQWGGAGVWSTGPDYLKLLTVLLNGGVGANGARILKNETVEMMYARGRVRRLTAG